jgi:hypothetical protein
LGEDLLDHRPLEVGRDDLQFPGATVRPVVHVDAETRLSSRTQLMRCGRTWTVSTLHSAAAAASVAGFS